VEEQNQEWLDENIMHGSVSVIARKVTPEQIARLDRVARAAFNDRTRNEEATLAGAVTTKDGDANVQKEAARRIALEGFLYTDSPLNRRPLEDRVKALVDALGPAADVESVVVEGRVKVDTDEENKTWRASTFVFANKKTGELVAFYARAGWI
jgi:hypothetical protein